jgi:2,3-bisphosphoglycerate-dependent phosphoglycerate mutase
MQLFLIRHAQSANNALPDHQRVEDPGLTDLGSQQAELLADWIAALELNEIFVSPFLRTLLTVEPIYRATGIRPHVRPVLHEQGGCYSGWQPHLLVGRPGMNPEQIKARFPDYIIDPQIDNRGWWRSQPYENYSQACERAARLQALAMQDLQRSDARIAYVMHADIKLRFLERIEDRYLETPWNSSVTALQSNQSRLELVDYNRVDHLPTDLRSR